MMFWTCLRTASTSAKSMTVISLGLVIAYAFVTFAAASVLHPLLLIFLVPLVRFFAADTIAGVIFNFVIFLPGLWVFWFAVLLPVAAGMPYLSTVRNWPEPGLRILWAIVGGISGSALAVGLVAPLTIDFVSQSAWMPVVTPIAFGCGTIAGWIAFRVHYAALEKETELPWNETKPG